MNVVYQIALKGSGGAYFITVRQVFEKVNISKTRLILSLDQNSNLFQTNDAGHQCDKCSYWLSEEICNLVDDLPTFEGKLSAETKSVLLYIAGYVIRKDEQREDTYYFCENFGSYLDELNRGGGGG